MRKEKNNINRVSRFFKLLYIKLFKINDSAQRIALGLGLGVFAGIIPGTGPLAALFLAFIFRVNRASALLGSLLTNTWLSIVTFTLSVKIGSAIMKLNWQEANPKLILPVIIGYFIVAFCLGFLTYLITLAIIIKIRYENKSRVDISR